MMDGIVSAILSMAFLMMISAAILTSLYFIRHLLRKYTGYYEDRDRRRQEQSEFLSLSQHDQNKKLISDIHSWVKDDHLDRAAKFMSDNYPYWRFAPSQSQSQINEWITMSVQMTKD